MNNELKKLSDDISKFHTEHRLSEERAQVQQDNLKARARSIIVALLPTLQFTYIIDQHCRVELSAKIPTISNQVHNSISPVRLNEYEAIYVNGDELAICFDNDAKRALNFVKKYRLKVKPDRLVVEMQEAIRQFDLTLQAHK